MTRLPQLLTSIALLTFGAGPVLAQDYWEYDYWEDEQEYHEPLEGEETEYEDGDVETESEAYEWEPDEGYHEEEWYDPSDWFDDDDAVDYEYDYDYGYDYYDPYDYDAYDYDYDYDYDYYDQYDYDYAYNDADYDYDQQVKGEVVGLQRLRGSNGQPESVKLRLRTEDGQTRTLLLGDVAYVYRYLPRIKKGDRVIIGGSNVNVQGRKVFKAEEMAAASGSYKIPDYQYERRLEGRLTGLRKVQLERDGATVDAVVAKVEPWEGKTLDVLLGDADDLERNRDSLRPGTRVQADGYRRTVDGESTFVVQDVKILGSDERQQQDRQDRQDRRQTRRDQRQQDRQAQRQTQRDPQGNR